MNPSGLYIHIPFCRKKCIYCDFFSGGASIADWKSYTDALLHEYSERKSELPEGADTLYIGGGTPSLMPDKELERLITGLEKMGGISRGNLSEFTIEVNPEDVTKDKCGLWRGLGVNRVSIGLQSLNDTELKAIKRNHDSAKALQALEILQRDFDNVSCDLIFGLPRQTMESWIMTVERVLSLRPEHISAYSLMFETGTAITMLRDKRLMTFPEEEESVRMWKYLSRRLKENGYGQYEISNYSLSGYESIHNSRYWKGNPYLGLGASAHSYDGGRIRRGNPAKLREYIERYSLKYIMDNKKPRFYVEEVLTDEELSEEMIMLRMRIKEGLDLGKLERKFGTERMVRVLDNIERFVDAGKVIVKDNIVSLTDDGIMVCDEVILGMAM